MRRYFLILLIPVLITALFGLTYLMGAKIFVKEQRIDNNLIERFKLKVGDNIKYFEDIKIQTEKNIGSNKYVVFSYKFQNKHRVACAIYKRVNKNWYIFDSFDGNYLMELSDNKISNINQKENVNGARFISTSNYLIMYGILNENETNQYEISSGSKRVIEVYPKNVYFIKESLLDNPMQFTARQIN